MSQTRSRSAALDAMLELLDLEALEINLFRGRSQSTGWQRVYGGQVLGQALEAALRTVPDERVAHSMHGYFLLGGDPTASIIYDVDRIRDGGSFTTRRVNAIQHGRAIFTMSASFHRIEDGPEHQDTMPDVPQPETLPSEAELYADLVPHLPENMRSFFARERAIEMRPVNSERYRARAIAEPKQCIWVRANGDIGADPKRNQAVLAYASDFALLDTALIAHGKLLFDTDIQLASLDHAMWFHRPFRCDDWLLYVQDSPFAGGARAYCRGSIFTRDGTLVASMTQEGLFRPRATAFVVT